MTNLLFEHLVESTLLCLFLGACAVSLRQCKASVRYALWLGSVVKFAVPTVLLTATGAWMAAVMPATTWILSWAPRLLVLLTTVFGRWPFRIAADETRFDSYILLAIWATGSIMMFGSWIYRLRVSYQSEGPTLIGLFRPMIIVPRGLRERLTEAEWAAVLRHEKAHAERWDNLASAFVHCLVCLFWFHPLLWFVERRLIAERERACDETVIDSGTDAHVYLSGLMKVCQWQILGDVAGRSAAGGSNLQKRFEQISAHRTGRPVPYLVRFAVAGVAMVLTILPIAGGYCEQCVSDGQNNFSQMEK
jgi:bla regulator protein blaR1